MLQRANDALGDRRPGRSIVASLYIASWRQHRQRGRSNASGAPGPLCLYVYLSAVLAGALVSRGHEPNRAARHAHVKGAVSQHKGRAAQVMVFHARYKPRGRARAHLRPKQAPLFWTRIRTCIASRNGRMRADGRASSRFRMPSFLSRLPHAGSSPGPALV